MTKSVKPEWFQITENDERPQFRKTSKSLPVSALIVTGLILGVGAVVSQAEEKVPSAASEVAALRTATSQSASTPETDGSPQSEIENKMIVSNLTTSAPVVAGATAGSALVNPSIAALPPRDDDDDDHHKEKHRHHDDHHDEGDDD